MKRARGFALVSAVFLIVVLAALGAVLVTLSALQHASFNQQLAGARAYYAARAGLEWGTARARAGSCSGVADFPLDVAAPMLVTVNCAPAPHELPAGLSAYTVIDADGHTSAAYGGGDFASRRLRGKVLVTP